MSQQSCAVLIGATGGIGQAIAEQLCKQGKPLVLVGRNEHKLESLRKRLRELYPLVYTISRICDISSAEDRQQLLNVVEQLPMGVDLLINNAGINHLALFEQQSDEEISEIIQINSVYPLLLLKLFLPYFLQRDKPVQIINVGSTFGAIASPGFVAYSASKFALRGATEALGREYADTPVRIRYFSPRATLTDLNSEQVVSMNRAMKVQMDPPERVAKELVNFLNNRKSIYYVGWPEKLFVVINQLLPKLVSSEFRKSLPLIRKYASEKSS
ncbi:SDR family oxidoreductase [Porticoccaceae bacterium LTM1]|nr:SDR family oxidoreductase [Porticoccaceae bacterium LTM1]